MSDPKPHGTPPEMLVLYIASSMRPVSRLSSDGILPEIIVPAILRLVSALMDSMACGSVPDSFEGPRERAVSTESDGSHAGMVPERYVLCVLRDVMAEAEIRLGRVPVNSR